MPKSSFDLFAVLKQLDKGNLTVYEDNCSTDDERKDFNKEVGWMLPQWMSSATNPKQQQELLVNVSRIAGTFGSLNDHPQLRAQLLATCGTGQVVKHRFPKAKKSVGYAPLHKLLLLSYPDIRISEVELWCKSNNIKDVESIAGHHGLQGKELEPILKLFKKITEAK